MAGEDLERGAKRSANRSYSWRSYDDNFGTQSDEWRSWLVPTFVLANVVVFVAVMFVNDCPRSRSQSGNCVARFLGRFSFQPLRQNPLFGASSST